MIVSRIINQKEVKEVVEGLVEIEVAMEEIEIEVAIEIDSRVWLILNYVRKVSINL